MRTPTLTMPMLFALGAFLGSLAPPLDFHCQSRADENSAALIAKKVASLVEQDEKRLLEVFQQLHAHPELGFQEVQTAALVAREFKALGYETHTGIGKTGVVGILKNGAGPVVMFRSDMDALPVLEETGLPYASRATGTSASGSLVPVMHACGHDAHVTFLIGVAKVLSELKEHWSGTLVLIAQPAEELIEGARAMVQGGLYDKAPPPDVLIASHVTPLHPTGTASVKAGRRNAGTDQIDVIITGVGGHGSAPHQAKNPVELGALAVIGYQSLVSQSIDPQEPSVLTVGAFQAGNANNVIPETATLKVNIRWFEPAVREKLIAGIKRVTDAIATAADVPPDRMPRYIMKGERRPADQRRRGCPPGRACSSPGPGRAKRRARFAHRHGFGGLSRPRVAPSDDQDSPCPHRLRSA